MNQPIIEFTLHQTGLHSFQIDLRLWLPGYQPKLIEADIPLTLDLDLLRIHALDPERYSQALTQMFFADTRIAEGWRLTYDKYAANGPGLRIRVAYPADSDELHSVHWELLLDPHFGQGGFLSLNERVLFSRFLTPVDDNYIVTPQANQFHALIVVANPEGLAQYNLAPIEVKREISFIEEALAGIPVDTIGTGISDQRVTLGALESALRNGPELVYLLAHSTRAGDDTVLWLEGADGSFDRVSTHDIVQSIRGRNVIPRLIVLASCHSAGEDDGALVALGPQLVLAGVPAVVAMPGPITQATLRHLLPTLFHQLRRYGQIEQALTSARRTVRGQIDDWWKPILFLGLHTGQLWPKERLQALNALVQGPGRRRILTPPITTGEETLLLAVHQRVHINHELEVQEVLSPIQKRNLTIQVARTWEHALTRHVLVTVVDAVPPNRDGQIALERVLLETRKREVAASYCPQLPRIYGIHMDGSRLWIMQEWIEGASLRALYPFSESLPSAMMLYDIVEVILAVCSALVIVHAQELQHGNITPDHIVVQRVPGDLPSRGTVLLDMPVDIAGHLTVAQVEAFQAPEQHQLGVKHEALSPAIDVYGLGATLYAIITHTEPVRPWNRPLRPASSLNPIVPHVCDEILACCLAPNPRDRYQNIKAFATALRDLLPVLQEHIRASNRGGRQL